MNAHHQMYRLDAQIETYNPPDHFDTAHGWIGCVKGTLIQ